MFKKICVYKKIVVPLQPISHFASKKVCLFNKKVFNMKKVFSF